MSCTESEKEMVYLAAALRGFAITFQLINQTFDFKLHVPAQQYSTDAGAIKNMCSLVRNNRTRSKRAAGSKP